MTTKAKKPARSTNPKSTKQSHVPTPWAKLREMWESGATYEAMAKGTDAHYDPSKPDPTKPTRAKIWKARNVGVTIEGKLVKFGARGKAKEGAKKGKPSKGVKKAAGKGKTKVGKKAAKAKSRPEEMGAKTPAKAAKPVSAPEPAKNTDEP